MSKYTIVERVPDQLGYRCGYCGNGDTAKAQGMWAHAMSTLDYQALIDRGWRRSGRYCYKPLMKETCCPQYTIRCRALEYRLTKSKKKVLNKMKQFLMSEGDDEIVKWKAKNEGKNKEQETESYIEAQDAETKMSLPHEGDTPQKQIKKGAGPDPSKPACKKAKLLRLERKRKKEMSFGAGDPAKHPPPEKQTQKSLQEQIPHLNPSPNFKRKLEVRMVRAHWQDKKFLETREESHAVYQKYQQAIHGDQPSDCTEKQWSRFLVDCPLHFDQSGPGPGYGNYHQQYLLDGKIIAVGVVDILPNSLSSVYLYYDTDYGFLTLGTYAALSEIAYTQTLHEESKDVLYYYIGFYIHSCPKMRYKGSYSPSEIVCPETYVWVPYELCSPALDKKKYCRLNVLNGGSVDDVDPERGDDFNMDELGVMYRRNLLKYYRYVRWKYIAIKFPEQNVESIDERAAKEQEEYMNKELLELKEYISIVGAPCAKRMHLLRTRDGEF